MTGAELTRTGDKVKLEVLEVGRDMAGELTCSADNGFQDSPVTKTVKVMRTKYIQTRNRRSPNSSQDRN